LQIHSKSIVTGRWSDLRRYADRHSPVTRLPRGPGPARYRECHARRAPGGGWAYSNTNYLLASLIAQQVTGRPFNELVTTRVIQRIGLRDTYAPESGDEEIRSRHPHGYHAIRPRTRWSTSRGWIPAGAGPSWSPPSTGRSRTTLSLRSERHSSTPPSARSSENLLHDYRFLRLRNDRAGPGTVLSPPSRGPCCTCVLVAAGGTVRCPFRPGGRGRRCQHW
jgi:CubicO group peptidase (beta-lactamase class C family)